MMNFDTAVMGLAIGAIVLLIGVYCDFQPACMAGAVLLGVSAPSFNRGIRGRLPKR